LHPGDRWLESPTESNKMEEEPVLTV